MSNTPREGDKMDTNSNPCCVTFVDGWHLATCPRFADNPAYTDTDVTLMMKELGQSRYVVKPHGDRAEGGQGGFIVVDTAHQDRQMSGVLGLEQAKGWAYGEHDSWARRLLARGQKVQNCYLLDDGWHHGTECDCGAPEGD